MNKTATHRSGGLSPALALALLATACASGPYTAEVLAIGGKQLNPTFDKQPSAVNVRLFPLIDEAVFVQASDADLMQSPDPKLGQGTWVPPYKDVVVYVGQRDRIKIEIKPQVRFLGVLGLFNEDTGARRLVIDVKQLAEKKLVFDGFDVKAEPLTAEDTK
ncbi:MAG TPA: type VI secretion system lipoprotein TssJ [Planctomycetota bacterium]|nr:type VI secretion system lipoprotein TssJ [Planctomycetota bacterium]